MAPRDHKRYQELEHDQSSSMWKSSSVSSTAPAASPPSSSRKRVKSTVSGDCLTAGFLAGVLRGLDQAGAVSVGLQAARLSCQVSPAVPETLNTGEIDWASPAEGIVLFEQI